MKIKNGIVALDTPIVDEKNGYNINTIDLNKLANKKIITDNLINGIKLESTFSPISLGNNSKMSIEYILTYKNDIITLTGTVKVNDKEIFNVPYEIDINILVAQIIESINNNMNSLTIANLNIIKTALDCLKDQAYKAAFDNNIILAQEVYNYRINIYESGKKNLIGLANRFTIHDNVIMLYELITFDPNIQMDRIDIQVVLDESKSVWFKDIRINSSSGKSIKYCAFLIESNSKAAIKLAGPEESFNADKLKLKGLTLPRKNNSTNYMVEDLLKENDQGALIKCYKQNKSMNITKLNVNRYLLS